jgi:hypothetical protein
VPVRGGGGSADCASGWEEVVEFVGAVQSKKERWTSYGQRRENTIDSAHNLQTPLTLLVPGTPYVWITLAFLLPPLGPVEADAE